MLGNALRSRSKHPTAVPDAAARAGLTGMATNLKEKSSRFWLKVFLVCLGLWIFRCGQLWLVGDGLFYSNGKIKELTLDLLECFSGVAKKHNARYWIAFGTLLGYARHNGSFIPWDKPIDIDVSMLEMDEPTFLKMSWDLNHQCGFWVHRNDPMPPSSWIFLGANIGPFTIQKSAFRLLVSDTEGYYVDFQDYSEKLSPDGSASYYNPRGAAAEVGIEFPSKDLLPLQDCVFENILVKCPNNIDRVLELTYGSNWRTPIVGFKTGDQYA